MINNKNNTDDFLKDLIQKSDIEKPSVDFTNKVMREVEAYSKKKSVLILLIKKINNWYYLAAAGLLVLIYLTYYFIPFNNLSLFEQYDPAFVSVFENIFYNFKQLFHSFQISSITLIIIIAIFTLFLTDRVLKKLHPGKGLYYSF